MTTHAGPRRRRAAARAGYAEDLLRGPRRRRCTSPPGRRRTPSDPEWAERVAAHRARRPGSLADRRDRRPRRRRCAAATGPCSSTASAPGSPPSSTRSAPGTTSTRAAAVRRRPAPASCSTRGARRRSTSSPSRNEVGMAVVPATASGRLFRDELGRLNAAVSAVSDRVALVVAGRVLDLSARRRRADEPRLEACCVTRWRLAVGHPHRHPGARRRDGSTARWPAGPWSLAPLTTLPALAVGVGARGPPCTGLGAPPLVLAAVALTVLVARLARDAPGRARRHRRRALRELRPRAGRWRSCAAATSARAASPRSCWCCCSTSPRSRTLAAVAGAARALAGVRAAGEPSRCWPGRCARPVPAGPRRRPGRDRRRQRRPAGRLRAAAPSVVGASVALAAGSPPVCAWWAGAGGAARPRVAGGRLVLRAGASSALGGITGDVLGAVVEIALAVGLTAAALVLPHAG